MDLMLGRSVKFAGLLIRTSSKLLPVVSHESLILNRHQILPKCSHLHQFHKRSLFSTLSSHKYFLQTSQTSSKDQRLLEQNVYQNQLIFSRFIQTSKSDSNKDCYPSPKPTVFQRMKQMTKDYWHILIPVHIVTSLGWVTIFYIAAKNGVDIIRILEWLNLSERYLDVMRDSNAGNWAITYALYKVFTPLRYTVTVGGTTVSIKYLNKWGYLKTKPTLQQIQSNMCAEEHRAKFSKSSSLKETEPPKT